VSPEIGTVNGWVMVPGGKVRVVTPTAV
jgi:hypothetical protein